MMMFTNAHKINITLISQQKHDMCDDDVNDDLRLYLDLEFYLRDLLTHEKRESHELLSFLRSLDSFL